jgi:hypothetical protein
MPKAWAFIWERWLSVDSRTLGLFRIGYGLLLLSNLYDRVGGDNLVSFYSNEGMLPNHYELYRPPQPDIWGLMFGFSSPNEVRFFVAFVLIVYLLYTLGLFTRLMQVLALVCLESLNWRFQLVMHGGAITTNLLAVWTVFLPLGQRFSLDSLFRTMRTHGAADAKTLTERGWRTELPQRYFGLAYFFTCIQWATIYVFNVLHKSGLTWHDGSAVHYVLWQNRVATHLAAFLRMHEPFWISPAMTWGTIVMESALPFLILTPVFQTWARRVAFLFIWTLHGSIALLCTLGPFSYSMMAFALLLVTADDWALLSSKLRRASLERIVRYDPKRPMHAFAARLLARLDTLGHLTFEEKDGPFEVARKGSAGVQGQSALAEATRALPLGPAYAWLWVLPLVGGLLDSIARLLARWWLERPKVEEQPSTEGALHRGTRRVVQIAVPPFLLVCCGIACLQWNQAVPPKWRPQSVPELFVAPINYLQIPQPWRMFAPEAPQDDLVIVVDATLADGTHIDPLTGQLPDFEAPLHGPWYMDQHWCEVHGRMPVWGEYWHNFKEYLFRVPQLQHWGPGKQIVSLTVYQVTAKAPPFGQLSFTDIQKRVLFDSQHI